MPRILSKVVINLLVIAIAVPAAFASAARADEAASVVPASHAPAMTSLRASTERAVVTTLMAEQSGPGTGMPTRPASTKIRAQGGGKAGMVMGLVSTVVGLAGAAYMIKYMRDQQKKTDGQ